MNEPVDVGCKPPSPRVHLGDGAFVEFDGWYLWIISSDGIRDTNRVALEPSAYAELRDYARLVGVER